MAYFVSLLKHSCNCMEKSSTLNFFFFFCVPWKPKNMVLKQLKGEWIMTAFSILGELSLLRHSNRDPSLRLWFTENRKLSGESDTLIWFRFNLIDSWLSFLCERAVQSWPCAAVFNRIAEADRLWATSFHSLPQQTLTAHEKEPTCFPVEEMALSVNEPVAFCNRNPKWLCAQSGTVRFMSGC